MSREAKIFASIDLVRRNQVLTQQFDEAAAEYLGINLIDARAIDVIDQHHGRLTAGELARELRLSTGAVTALVDRLEAHGYAQRVDDPDDRRRVLLKVTPAVLKASEQIYGKAEDAIDWASSFSDAELDTLLRYLELSTKWLEERLAHVDRLQQAKTKKRASR